MTNNQEVEEFWPEPEWIQNLILREKMPQTGLLAMERSSFKCQGLREIPMTLQVEGCKVSLQAGKGLLGQLAPDSALKMDEFLGDDMPVDANIFIAGATLADVGKFFGLESAGGKGVRSAQGGVPYAA